MMMDEVLHRVKGNDRPRLLQGDRPEVDLEELLCLVQVCRQRTSTPAAAELDVDLLVAIGVCDFELSRWCRRVGVRTTRAYMPQRPYQAEIRKVSALQVFAVPLQNAVVG